MIEFQNQRDIAYTNQPWSQRPLLNRKIYRQEKIQTTAMSFMAFAWYFVSRSNAGSEESFEAKFCKEFRNPAIFLSFARSMYSTLIYQTHHAYAKYVKTLLFSQKGWTIARKFSEKSFQPTHRIRYKKV